MQPATWLKAESAAQAMDHALATRPGPESPAGGTIRLINVIETPELRTEFIREWTGRCGEKDRLLHDRRAKPGPDLPVHPLWRLGLYSRMDCTHLVLERLPEDTDGDFTVAFDHLRGVQMIVLADPSQFGPLFGGVSKAA